MRDPDSDSQAFLALLLPDSDGEEELLQQQSANGANANENPVLPPSEALPQLSNWLLAKDEDRFEQLWTFARSAKCPGNILAAPREPVMSPAADLCRLTRRETGSGSLNICCLGPTDASSVAQRRSWMPCAAQVSHQSRPLYSCVVTSKARSDSRHRGFAAHRPVDEVLPDPPRPGLASPHESRQRNRYISTDLSWLSVSPVCVCVHCHCTRLFKNLVP